MAEHIIYIDGAAGTTGLQIHGRLEGQPGIQVLTLPQQHRKSLPHRVQAVAQADVSILCLPDAAAKELVAAAPADAKICDASTAHRTNPAWVYGFAELSGHRQAIKAAHRVAVPGCHASGYLALAAPLAQNSILAQSQVLQCTSLTGYSGGGKAMIEAYEAADRPAAYASPRLYGLGMAHKHLPEMQAVSGLAAPPLFMPIVDDYYSGMLVSLPLPAQSLAPACSTPEKLRAFYQNYYQGEPLIQVQPASAAPQDGTLAANTLAGRDVMEIHVLGNEEQILLAARFDNLGKGAAGAAVQCLNLMLGREELSGLRL